MFILISVLFFTYGVHLEKQVIVNQMKLLSFDFMKTFELTGKKSNKELYNFTNDVLLSKENIAKISADDADQLKGNQKIINDVILYVGSFFVAVLIIVSLICYFSSDVNRNDGNDVEGDGKKGVNIGGILLESFIILVFIGITEFLFLEFFGSKFISINTNNVKKEIIQSLQSYNESVTLNKPRESDAAH